MTKSDASIAAGAWTALAVLFVVSVFNYLDRFVLSVLLPSIKDDLLLSDTQLGAIGSAFTLSYVLLGIPFARLADRYSRKNIVAISLAIWSAMTAACGLARSFVEMIVLRTMVGVGEAGATPPAHSLIADYFPLSTRTKALSVFGCGAPVGLMIGFVVAGWLVAQYNWRIAFFALGVPGIVFALVVLLAIREPVRGASSGHHRDAQLKESPTFFASVKLLLSSAAYRHLSIATGLFTVVYIGAVSWLPSYFIRSFDLGIREVGFWLAMSLGLSQLVGMLVCGALTDRLIARSVRWYCWIPALAMFVSMPLLVVVFALDSALWATVLLAPAFMICVFQGPACFAAIQSIAHVRTRALAVAVFLLIVNLIGGTLGPLFTGWLSDQFANAYGDDSLKYSLMFVSAFFGLWAGLHYALAARTIEQEIEAHQP